LHRIHGDLLQQIRLVVDKTFQAAEGGVLMNDVIKRWGAVCEADGDDFDEREPFDNLLEEVDSPADTATDYHHEGVPCPAARFIPTFCDAFNVAAAISLLLPRTQHHRLEINRNVVKGACP
jgi:hypothetical protein